MVGRMAVTLSVVQNSPCDVFITAFLRGRLGSSVHPELIQFMLLDVSGLDKRNGDRIHKRYGDRMGAVVVVVS